MDTGFLGGHAGNYIEDELKPFGIESAFYHMKQESRSCINIWDSVNKIQRIGERSEHSCYGPFYK